MEDSKQDIPICPELLNMSSPPQKRTLDNLDDSQDQVLPYDPNSQEDPKVPFYHKLAKEAQDLGSAIIVTLENFMVHHEYRGEELQYFISWLQERRKPIYEEPNFYLALTGRSGVGKSTLLNAIIGHNLAINGNSGKSVTYVVQEFHYQQDSQSLPFEAHVCFYTVEVWREIIEQQFMNFMDYQEQETKANSGPRNDAFQDELVDSEDEDTRGIDYEKLAEARSRANSALGIFQAIFPDLFPTREDAKMFLQKATSNGRARGRVELERLQENIDDLYITIHNSAVGVRGDEMVFSASLAEKLKNLVRPFIGEVYPAPFIPGTKLKCSLWPFVKVVKYYVKSRNLMSGNIIVDTPGVTDTDLSRVDETLRYIQSSDITIITDDFKRMATQDGNFRELDIARRRKGPRGAILVGTNVDLLTENDDDFHFTPEEGRDIREIRQQYLEAARKIEKLQFEAKQAALDKCHEYAYEIQGNIVPERKIQMELNQKANDIRVNALHRRVAENIHNYGTRDLKDVPIFLVSSYEWLEKYVEGYNILESPKLSKEATGIPRLSDFIYSRPAEGKFAVLENWAKNVLSECLSRFGALATISNLEQKEMALGYCRDARTAAKANVNSRFKSLLDGSLLMIVAKMRENESEFGAKAAMLCDKKQSTIKGPTHLAVLKRQGKHKTPKIEQQDWNDEFLQAVRVRVDTKFRRTLDGVVKTKVTQLNQDISGVMGRLFKDLSSDPSSGRFMAAAASNTSHQQQSNAFQAYGKARVGLFEREVDIMRERLDDALRDIHSKATQNVFNSYFARAMANVYDQTILSARGKKKPKGVTQHTIRCEFLKSAMCKSNGPFHKLTNEVERAFKDVAETLRDELVQKVDKVFAPIEEDIHREIRASENGQDNTLKKKFLEDLEKMVENATPEIKEVTDMLDQCKKECLTT